MDNEVWKDVVGYEGLSIGNCDAGDLLYCDVLSGAEDTVYDTLGQKAEDFVCKYESWGVK